MSKCKDHQKESVVLGALDLMFSPTVLFKWRWIQHFKPRENYFCSQSHDRDVEKSLVCKLYYLASCFAHVEED